jgi:hypothetical protein
MSGPKVIDDDLPTVEIKVSKARSGQVVMHERYQVAPELAETLANELNEVLALLPEADQRRITKTERKMKRPNGQTVTRIDLTVQPRRPVTQPSFEQQFKSEGEASPGGEVPPEGETPPGGGV